MMPSSVSCTPEPKRLLDPICQSEHFVSTSGPITDSFRTGARVNARAEAQGIEVVTSDCPHVYLAKVDFSSLHIIMNRS